MKGFDFDTAWEELFEEGLPDSFTFGELFDKMVGFNGGALPPDKDAILDRIAESLLGSEEYFLKGLGDSGYAVSRQSFFAGASFKILPEEQEIKKGILLCGARFVPFVSPEIFAGEYELSCAEEPEKILKTKKISGFFANFCRPYLLLGRSETLDTLAAESSKNYEEMRTVKSLDKAKVTLTVYDLASFYERHSFKLGDAILVKIVDWECGKFILEYCPAALLPQEEEKEKFLTVFEDSIAETFKIFGEYQLLCDQISYAYFFASQNSSYDLRKTPALSLDEYPARMRDIAVNRDDAEWFLMPVESDDYEYSNVEESFEEPEENCSCGHEHHHAHGEECHCHDHAHDHSGVKAELTPEEKEELYAHEEGFSDPRIPRHFSLSKGRMDSLEGILDDIHSPVPYVEIYGIMLDFLANGGEDFKSFFEILTGEMNTKFVDEAQETAFINFLEEVWEDALEKFNPVHESTKMGLRSRVLALTSAHREFGAFLLHKYKGKVPGGIILKMKSIHGRLMETLGVINADSSLPEDEEFENFELRIGDLEDEWDELRDSCDAPEGDA